MSDNSMDQVIRQAAGRQSNQEKLPGSRSSGDVVQSVADQLGLPREEVEKRLQEQQPPPPAGAGAGTGSGGKPPAGDAGGDMERLIRRAAGAPDPVGGR
jgi:hypothetical protein